MDAEDDLINAKHEVQRKIGRNLILFQRIEHMLKWLVANSRVQGYLSEFNSIRERQTEEVAKSTLGNLVGRYIENHQPLSNFDKEEGPVELKEPIITFSTCVADDDNMQSQKDLLVSLVAERNDLVHHLVARINPESIASWQETEKHLDRQFEMLQPMHGEFQDRIKGIQESRKEFAKFLLSEEGDRYLRLGSLHQEKVVLMLIEIADQRARHDGWTMLSTAGYQINKKIPGELAAVKRKYRLKTLRELVLSTELFEILKENLSRGGFRELYRLKPETSKSN